MSPARPTRTQKTAAGGGRDCHKPAIQADDGKKKKTQNMQKYVCMLIISSELDTLEYKRATVRSNYL